MPSAAKPASEQIARQNAAAGEALALADERDFEDARRGFLAAIEPGRIERADGEAAAWDLASFEFLDGERPASAHPSLWRQSRLAAISGLFEVAPGFYQLRGVDLSNMTIVEGSEGIVVIDPLISVETAAAGIELYRRHRGDRPVTGLVFTHSHVDHFGGSCGVVSSEDVATGRVPVLAPEGFLEHAVSENVYAGTAMARRAAYMYGSTLPRGPQGTLGCGLGMATSSGRVTILAPTLEIAATGQEETVDGVRFVFQLAPDTEAPAEMNFHFPEHRVLCVAETATRTMHNLITLRGALVRDPRVWARSLTETIELFGAESDVLFAGHHWPTWGGERIRAHLEAQRDLYAYIHDQTLRLINRGLGPAEIAEQLELPPALEREWSCRGYYGSLSHNVKAVYQRYMGWFDGNPANLWPHPPTERGRRYVELAGGAEALLERAREAYAAGDLRWVAELAGHLVFAEPENAAARELEADALEQLGYGAENATWRNFFLTGAQELRRGVEESAKVPVSPDLVAQLPVAQILDGMASRLDAPRAWEASVSLVWEVTDTGERYALRLANGVLTHTTLASDEARGGSGETNGARGEATAVDATLRFERAALDELIAETTPVEELFGSGRMAVEGDAAKLGELLSLLDQPDPSFAIVTAD